MLSKKVFGFSLLTLVIVGLVALVAYSLYYSFNPIEAVKNVVSSRVGFADVEDAYSGKPYTERPNPANMADSQSPAMENQAILPTDLAAGMPSFVDLVPSGDLVDISGPLLNQRQIVDRVNKNSSQDLRGDIPTPYQENGSWLQSPYGMTGSPINREIVIQQSMPSNPESSGVQAL